MRLEKDFQNFVNKKLRTLKNTWFVKIADRAKKGIPDYLLCVDGRFIAIEIKRSITSRATPLQEHTLYEIREAAGCGWVVFPENWDQVWVDLKTLAGGLK